MFYSLNKEPSLNVFNGWEAEKWVTNFDKKMCLNIFFLLKAIFIATAQRDRVFL